MAWDAEETERVEAIEAALADAVAKIGAFQTLIETKFDFDSKKLFADTYDSLKPAP